MIASLVKSRTSLGMCLYTGRGWGSARLAILDEDSDKEKNILDRFDRMRRNADKDGIGCIVCLLAAIDLEFLPPDRS